MAEEIDYEEEMVDHSAEKADVVESSRSIATKGRGHNRRDEENDRYNGGGGVFERLEQSAGPGPLQCKDDLWLYWFRFSTFTYYYYIQ